MDYEEDIRKYAEGLNQTKIVSVYRNLYIFKHMVIMPKNMRHFFSKNCF